MQLPRARETTYPAAGNLSVIKFIRLVGLKVVLPAYVLLGLAACSQPENSVAEPTSEKAVTVTELASGAKIAGANGILFAENGDLYIASVLGSSLTIVDPDTGEIKQQLSAESGVYGPDDLAFAPDGAVYWTSILTGVVGGITASGEQIVAATLGPGVNPIAFSDDGRLFVAQCFYGSKLYELDPMGVEEARLISDQLGSKCGLNGMDWGPDNRLYGPRWFNGEVVSFNVDDNTMRLEASGFKTPAAVKFDSAGVLHVLDTEAGKVFSVVDGVFEVVAELEPGLDNFAFDKNDRIFVSSFTDGFIKRQEDDGSMQAILPGGLAHPGGIDVFKGQLIVADLHAIRQYDPLTGKAVMVQRNIFGSGKMGSTLNIAADGGNLILTAWTDGSVRIWDPVQQQVVWRLDNLENPVAALRYHGQIVVAEHGKQGVFAFDEDGSAHELIGGIESPTGLAVFAGGLYLSDYLAGNILKIAQDGIKLENPEIIASGLTTPEGFVVSGNGLVVVESGPGHILYIDLNGQRRVLAEISPGSAAASPEQPPSMVFNGITQGEDGAYYLPVETSRTLIKVEM